MTVHPLFPDLHSTDIAVGWGFLGEWQGELHPEEWQDIAGAAPQRQKEFSAGRRLVAQMAADLNLPTLPLRRANDRSPEWPEDRLGSLSHCDTLCAAAVAKGHAAQSIGIDIETIGRVDEKLWSALFTDRERDYLGTIDRTLVGAEATVLFSAKESFYKCQYTLTRSWVGFHDVEVTRIDEAQLAITPVKAPHQPWHTAPLHVAYLADKHVATLMVIPTPAP